MTANYTHTWRETHREKIERALRLWPESLHLASAFAPGVGSEPSESHRRGLPGWSCFYRQTPFVHDLGPQRRVLDPARRQPLPSGRNVGHSLEIFRVILIPES